MQEFVAVSASMQEIKRVSVLMQNTKINTLIVGESGVGKSKLAKEIAPNAYIIDGTNQNAITDVIKQFDDVLIENFDGLNLSDWNLNGKRIIATAKIKPRDNICERLFGLTLELLPLSQRKSDIAPLLERFMSQASSELNLAPIDVGKINPDISQNCHSLKRSVYAELIRYHQNSDEFIASMQAFFENNIQDDDNYHLFLDMFDKALILANQTKYKSQLMMSKMMGINRNTLRKKMSQLGLEG
jgi:DNA-binding NtrC family response regulator